MSTINYYVNPLTEEIMEPLDITGSNLFTVYVVSTNDNERARITSSLETYAQEFVKFREMLPRKVSDKE